MNMIPVISSAISAIGYDSQTRKMKITFTQGHTYDFCSVPASVFEGLKQSSSKGTYYNDQIKGRYEC